MPLPLNMPGVRQFCRHALTPARLNKGWTPSGRYKAGGKIGHVGLQDIY